MEKRKGRKESSSFPSPIDLVKIARGQKGKRRLVFELSMWLKSLLSFTRDDYLALFASESQEPFNRNYAEEVKILSNLLVRITNLLISIMGQEQWNIAQFKQYIERLIIEHTPPMVKLADAFPYLTDEYSNLFDDFVNMRIIARDFMQMKWVSYLSFSSLGKLINQNIDRFHFLSALKELGFNPDYDQVANRRIAEIIKNAVPSTMKQGVAQLFLSLFRLLNYLNFVQLRERDIDSLKLSLPILALFYFEAELLFSYLTAKYVKKSGSLKPFARTVDNLIFASKLELMKVYNLELSDMATIHDTETIYTKLDNSRGILSNHIKQWIVIFAQLFDPEITGGDIFIDFVARVEESLQLREDLWCLIRHIDEFQEKKNKQSYKNLVDFITKFGRSSMKYLMYRDWRDFSLMAQSFNNAESLEHRLFAAHKFSTYLALLFEQVGKRAALSAHPFKPPSVRPS
jgi:hypothetical protein